MKKVPEVQGVLRLQRSSGQGFFQKERKLKQLQRDLEELPPKTRWSMTFVTVDSMDEVLATALVAKEKGVGASGAGDTTPAASPT